MALSLGAKDEHTGKYVHPEFANKKGKYSCLDCEKELVPVKGNVRIHHFRHKVDDNPCHYYSNPTESQIHKSAQMFMKTLLENSSIQINRSCICCKKNIVLKLPEIPDDSSIVLEYRFEHKFDQRLIRVNAIYDEVGSMIKFEKQVKYTVESKIADVAMVHNETPICIFEILHTHKTRSEDRPEPWFELDAPSLLMIKNTEAVILNCIREEPCSVCYMGHLKTNNLEKYVRIKLGQNFENPTYKENIMTNENGEDFYKVKHARFDYDADDCYETNKEIIDIFDNDYSQYKVVLYSHKGLINAYLVSKEDDSKYDYWSYKHYNGIKLPYEYEKEYAGPGTVEIIVDLINLCKLHSSGYKNNCSKT